MPARGGATTPAFAATRPVLVQVESVAGALAWQEHPALAAVPQVQATSMQDAERDPAAEHLATPCESSWAALRGLHPLRHSPGYQGEPPREPDRQRSPDRSRRAGRSRDTERQALPGCHHRAELPASRTPSRPE